VVVDRYSCRLAVLGGLNRVRDGGRDPRQDLRPEWRCARWVCRPWRDGCSGPVAADESPGNVMVFRAIRGFVLFMMKEAQNENRITDCWYPAAVAGPCLNSVCDGRGLLPCRRVHQPRRTCRCAGFPCSDHGCGCIPGRQGRWSQTGCLTAGAARYAPRSGPPTNWW
jgi:hypothetical protein